MSTTSDPASTMNQNLLNTQNSWSSYENNANQQMATLQSEIQYMDQLQAEGNTGAIMVALLVMNQCSTVIGMGVPETDSSGNTQYQGIGANEIRMQESTQFGQMATYAQYNYQQLLTEGADYNVPGTIQPGQTTANEQYQAGQLTETLTNMQNFCQSIPSSSSDYDQAQSISAQITSIQNAITVNGDSNAEVAATIMSWGNTTANQAVPPASGSGSTNTNTDQQLTYTLDQQNVTLCNGAFASISNNSTGISTALQKTTEAYGSAFSTYFKSTNGSGNDLVQWESAMVRNQNNNS